MSSKKGRNPATRDQYRRPRENNGRNGTETETQAPGLVNACAVNHAVTAMSRTIIAINPSSAHATSEERKLQSSLSTCASVGSLDDAANRHIRNHSGPPSLESDRDNTSEEESVLTTEDGAEYDQSLGPAHPAFPGNLNYISVALGIGSFAGLDSEPRISGMAPPGSGEDASIPSANFRITGSNSVIGDHMGPALNDTNLKEIEATSSESYNGNFALSAWLEEEDDHWTPLTIGRRSRVASHD